MKDTEPPLVEILMLKFKQELALIAKCLHISINKSAKKDVIAKIISEFIIEHPQAVLLSLNIDNLLRLQQLINIPKNKIILAKYEYIEDDLVRIGIARVKLVNNKFIEQVYPDIINLFAPIIDTFVKEALQNDRYKKEQFVLGLINLYGIITIKEIETIYKEYDETITLEELHQLVKDSFMLTSIYSKKVEKFKECFTSTYVESPEMIIQERRTRKLPRYTNFTKDDIMNLGNSFSPIPPCENIKKIKKLFLDLKYSPEDTEYIISMLWSNSNNMPVDEQYDEGLIFFDPNSNKKINRVQYLEIVSDFTSDIPKWILHGSSAAQLFRMYFSNYVPEDESEENSSVTEEEAYRLINEHIAKTTSIVDQDKPCPCGSGKKFKVCCGNN